MHYVDLTQPFVNTMPVFPGDPAASLTPTLQVSRDGCADHTLHTGMHVGTHMDAPAHMLEGAEGIEHFPLERMHTRGVVVDARGARSLDRNLFEAYTIEPKMTVIVSTGWSARFETGTAYDFSQMPLLTQDAAAYLVSKKINALVLDTPTPDVSPFPQHKILLGAHIYIVENACNTEALTGAGAFECIIAPLRLHADAAPIRLCARVYGVHADIPRGKYRHYKGHEYRVVDMVTHSESLERMVLYTSAKGDSWVRPLSMFSEMVTVDGHDVPRFAYIGE